MKELLEVIAKRLVEHPEQVVVAETNNERALILELKVAPEDMGKVIGKQGRIAKAIRTVVKAAGIHEDKKIIMKSCSKQRKTVTAVGFFLPPFSYQIKRNGFHIWKIILKSVRLPEHTGFAARCAFSRPRRTRLALSG